MVGATHASPVPMTHASPLPMAHASPQPGTVRPDAWIAGAPDPGLTPSLRPLAERVRLRALVEWLRLGLLAALAGAALIVLSGRLLGRPEWAITALIWAAVALGTSLVLALARRPGIWQTARAADDLGLAERVSSALYANRSGHPAAALLTSDAARSLAGIDATAYPVVPDPRRWRGVGLAGLALVLALGAPIPALGDGGRRAAEAQAVTAAGQSVEALRAGLPDPLAPEPLAQATAAELQALTEALAEAESAAEAAQALEQAQGRLASLADAEDYAWRRALAGLASSWSGHPDLGGLAQALATHDPGAIEEALGHLAAGVEQLTPEERQRRQLALQTGANAARDVPALAGALRQAATRTGAPADEPGDEGAALTELAPLFREGAARSVGLATVQRAVAGLGQARAALGPLGRSAGGTGLATSGSPTGSAAGGRARAGQGTGSPSGTGSGSASGSLGSASSGGSAGSGSAGSGSGTGSAGSSGSGSGAGAGAGAGAGTGGGPAAGQPGAGNTGPTGAGGSDAPSTGGTTTYDPIFAPSRLGGADGPQVQVPGDSTGAGGETVEVPESPLELGAIRPYDEVYGRYEADAR